MQTTLEPTERDTDQPPPLMHWIDPHDRSRSYCGRTLRMKHSTPFHEVPPDRRCVVCEEGYDQFWELWHQ